MILLSRLIKPVWPNLEQSEKKVIAIKMIKSSKPEAKEQVEAGIEKTTTALLNEAKAKAEQMKRQAKLEYESVMRRYHAAA